jgi:hypothetical protein
MVLTNNDTILEIDKSVLGDQSVLGNIINIGFSSLNPVPSSAPLNLSGVVNRTTITLNWNQPVYTNGLYLIYNIYLTSNGVTTLAGSVKSPITTFVVSNLTPYASYTFSVNATSSDNLTSGFSNKITLNTTCFLDGTKILYWNKTKNCEEYIPVQHLRKGMEVKTALNGFLKIVEIGSTHIHNFIKTKKNKDGLYKLSTETSPELFEDLYMTGAHCVLVDEFASEEQRNDVMEMYGIIYITGNKYRLPISLYDKAEPYNKEGEFKIWHFALENPDYYSNYGIYANGLLVESTSIRYMKEVFECKLEQ